MYHYDVSHNIDGETSQPLTESEVPGREEGEQDTLKVESNRTQIEPKGEAA